MPIKYVSIKFDQKNHTIQLTVHLPELSKLHPHFPYTLFCISQWHYSETRSVLCHVNMSNSMDLMAEFRLIYIFKLIYFSQNRTEDWFGKMLLEVR